jgi:hypothetical protein
MNDQDKAKLISLIDRYGIVKVLREAADYVGPVSEVSKTLERAANRVVVLNS